MPDYEKEIALGAARRELRRALECLRAAEVRYEPDAILEARADLENARAAVAELEANESA
jgi:hypothetical protein